MNLQYFGLALVGKRAVELAQFQHGGRPSYSVKKSCELRQSYFRTFRAVGMGGRRLRVQNEAIAVHRSGAVQR
jgi:hypothetical protein